MKSLKINGEQLFVLIIALLLNIILLILLDGPIWSIFCMTFLFLSLTFLYLIFHPYLKIKKSSVKFKTVLFLLTIFTYMLFPFFMMEMTHLKAEANSSKLQKIVHKLVDNIQNDEEKTLRLLEWFNISASNIYNDYHLTKNGAKIYPIHINVELITKKPYIGVRTFNDEDSLWILTSKFGHCGEYALIFRDMAHTANLTVRKVTCKGEDHSWNEVLIDDEWVIVDATRVGVKTADNNYQKFYNLDPAFMEKKLGGNISYVYAEYPNGKKEDITHRYTKLTTINILVQTPDKKPCTDVSIRVISHNRQKPRDIGINDLVTDENGKCSFIIGGGHYTIIAKTNGLMPLYGETTLSSIENHTYNLTIIMKLNWKKEVSLMGSLIAILILIVDITAFWYNENKKAVNKSFIFFIEHERR